MKRGMVWRVSVTTSPEAEEAVAELLGRSYGQPVSSYTDAETRKTTVTIYLPERPDWSAAKQRELELGLEQIVRAGLDIGPGSILLRRIPRKDWAESWKLHFKPLVVGSALLLKPSWSRRRPRKGQAVIVLDPGLSFGTGRHPTTAFCLRQLAARRAQGKAQSCLDIGTGSGILAIAAARLGYGQVDALDCDPESIRIARGNARRNGVAAKIRFVRQDLAQLRRWSARKYSVICANLVASLLVVERERILARLHAEGLLVVAGILRTEFEEVQRAYESAGLRLTASQTQNEWRSGAFAWRACCPSDSGRASAGSDEII
jgi:ribosomal protein L11 methyltransferase